MRWLLPILILLIGAGGFMTLKASKPDATALESKEKAWIVATMGIQHADLSPTLTLYGRVESPQIAELSAALSADVMSVKALEGESVDKGDLLVVLDDREALLTLRQRQAETAEIQAQIKVEHDRHRNNRTALRREQQLLELSRLSVSRAAELISNNVGSQSQLDAARQDEARQLLALDNREALIRQFTAVLSSYESKLARAQALTEQAALDLSRTQIGAPFPGRVSRLMVAAGDRVAPGQAMLRLIDTSRLEIRAQIPTRQLPRIRAALRSGEKLSAVSHVDDQRVESVLDRFSGEISLGSGGVDGFFRVAAADGWLQLGRTVELAVTLPIENHVVALPLEAIYGDGRVYKFVNGRMHALDVKNLGEIAVEGQTRALVSSPDLADGDEVVITQLPNAIDGLRVRVAQTNY